MLKELYPIIAYIFSMGLAQLSKPFLHMKKEGFNIKHIVDSGGYPSSHTSGTVALALAIGFKDGFTSSLFAIALVLMIIVTFDSGNVRYYAGRNNQETLRLIKDLDDKNIINTNDYNLKLKEVLGHTKKEILAGFILGIVVAIIFKFIFGY